MQNVEKCRSGSEAMNGSVLSKLLSGRHKVLGCDWHNGYPDTLHLLSTVNLIGSVSKQ